MATRPTRDYTAKVEAARQARLAQRTQRYDELDIEVTGLFDEIMELVFPVKKDGTADLDTFNEELAEALKRNLTTSLANIQIPATTTQTPAQPARVRRQAAAPATATPAAAAPAATAPPTTTAAPAADNGSDDTDQAQPGRIRRAARVVLGGTNR